MLVWALLLACLAASSSATYIPPAININSALPTYNDESVDHGNDDTGSMRALWTMLSHSFGGGKRTSGRSTMRRDHHDLASTEEDRIQTAWLDAHGLSAERAAHGMPREPLRSEIRNYIRLWKDNAGADQLVLWRYVHWQPVVWHYDARTLYHRALFQVMYESRSRPALEFLLLDGATGGNADNGARKAAFTDDPMLSSSTFGVYATIHDAYLNFARHGHDDLMRMLESPAFYGVDYFKDILEQAAVLAMRYGHVAVVAHLLDESVLEMRWVDDCGDGNESQSGDEDASNDAPFPAQHEPTRKHAPPASVSSFNSARTNFEDDEDGHGNDGDNLYRLSSSSRPFEPSSPPIHEERHHHTQRTNSGRPHHHPLICQSLQHKHATANRNALAQLLFGIGIRHGALVPLSFLLRSDAIPRWMVRDEVLAHRRSYSPALFALMLSHYKRAIGRHGITSIDPADHGIVHHSTSQDLRGFEDLLARSSNVPTCMAPMRWYARKRFMAMMMLLVAAYGAWTGALGK